MVARNYFKSAKRSTAYLLWKKMEFYKDFKVYFIGKFFFKKIRKDSQMKFTHSIGLNFSFQNVS